MTTQDIIDVYNNNAEQYAHSRLGSEDIKELKKFVNELPQSSKVLDVGCAAGRDTRILKDLGCEAYGTDLADKLIEIARISNPDILFTVADMRALPYKDDSFDGVWVSAVLHHVEVSEMALVIREFKRILKSDGLLYILTKTGKGKLISKESSTGNEAREFNLITSKKLHDLLVANGFSKQALEEKQSKTRIGLAWTAAYYRKC